MRKRFTLEDLNRTLILMYITIDYRARGGTSAKTTKVLIDKNPSGTFQTLHEPVPEIHWVTSILSSQEEEKAAWPPTTLAPGDTCNSDSSGQRDDDEGDLVMVLKEPNSTNLVPDVLIRQSGTVKGKPEWESDKDVLNHPKVKLVLKLQLFLVHPSQSLPHVDALLDLTTYNLVPHITTQ
ncbi:hypothetical protein FCIRC_2263 [Fusarium circinatum]|uniref:Uncharacterized protein n=1 Tax=Fusarium circinatum TaxID=48490 RepID=A0A8H5X504_FUSCI|nr:hypothetical protein FCIRC_2263 [Fusarium circinatum]